MDPLSSNGVERAYDRPPIDDDDDQNKEYEDAEHIDELPLFESLADYTTSEPGDLSFKKSDVLLVLATRADGWWQVENKRGERGLVPSTYLKVGVPVKVYVVGLSKNRIYGFLRCIALMRRLQVLQVHSLQTDISDTLEADGQLPKGSKPSSLYKLRKDNPRLSIEYHILPKLSKSGIGFHDLYWNLDRDKLRKRHVRFTKIFELLRCENLQFETGSLDVVCPFVRFCLFDGTRIISNIHEIKAQYDKKKPTLWTFLGKLGPNKSCAELRSFFVRSNFATNDAKLLVEVGYSYLTPNKEYGELSIGWTKLPLLTESGQIQLQEDRLLMVQLTPGTPFDHTTFDVAVVEEVSLLKNLVGAHKNPSIVFRMTSPSEDKKHLLDSLPDTLIWNSTFIEYLFLYRRYAGQEMVRDKIQQDGGTLISDTFLASFPKAAADPEIMDVLNILWMERAKSISRQDQKSEERLTSIFVDFFLSTGFALLQSAYNSNSSNITNPALLQRKREDFRQFVKIYSETKSAIAWLTTKSAAPLNLRQVFVDLSDVYAD